MAVPFASEGVTVLDNWDTLGMRGTASNDIVLEDVFVPDERVLANRPYGVVDPPLQVIVSIAIPIISAVYLGVAEAAYAAAVEAVRRRADDPIVQRQVGLMRHRLQVASWALDGALDVVGDDPAPSVDTLAAVMVAKREIALAGIEVCDLAMEVAGGPAFFKGSVIERCYRDIRAAKFHPLTPEETLLLARRAGLRHRLAHSGHALRGWRATRWTLCRHGRSCRQWGRGARGPRGRAARRPPVVPGLGPGRRAAGGGAARVPRHGVDVAVPRAAPGRARVAGGGAVPPRLRTQRAGHRGYHVGALMADAVALHGELGGDERTVLVGHDWGAIIANALGAHPDSPYRRVVTLAVPPLGAMKGAPVRLTPRQLRMSWYTMFNQLPVLPERTVDHWLPRLWRDWSPGYDAAEDVALVRAAWPTREHVAAAVGYYRAIRAPWRVPPAYRRVGADPRRHPDGARSSACTAPTTAACRRRTPSTRPAPAGTARFVLVSDAGHFLQVERPDSSTTLVAGFLSDG